LTPFGTNRGSGTTTWPDDKAFLGKTADADTGLSHIGAREYDPAIGQFTNVDPLLQVDIPQTLNGYPYASQNLVSHVDPGGMGLLCGRSGEPVCPTSPDSTPGNGRPNEALKPAVACWSGWPRCRIPVIHAGFAIAWPPCARDPRRPLALLGLK
jgi:RHS repeat-associated protein